MAENRQDKSVQLKNTAGSRPSSATRGKFVSGLGTMHWFAYLGPDPCNPEEDREAKIKSFKERQNEERQKKLDEMKSQALAAQRFKEQKEHERRQRLDELRMKEDERRQQVEERKRAINEAERDRLESILKRNQEREARIEAKRRNERSSLVFAFGSSTPRMLGPSENVSSFWGHRRATSTQNITYSAAPLTRRQSERELDGGSKKRATSAGGLERSGEATTPQHPAGCASGYVGRRRTDLMPTIPAKESPSTTPPRKPFMRSPAHSRPSSSLSQQSTSSVTSSVTMRSRPSAAPRRQRPVSIAVTGITSEVKNGTGDTKKQENKPPLPKARKSSLAKSQEKIIKKKSIGSPTEGSPKAIASPTSTAPGSTIESPSSALPAQSFIKGDLNAQDKQGTEKELFVTDDLLIDKVEPENVAQVAQLIDLEQRPIETKQADLKPNEMNLSHIEKADLEKEVAVKSDNEAPLSKPEAQAAPESQPQITELSSNEADMTTSFSAKPRITTEEEAKAALAERRRLAREEAERQAELERLRIEEERRLEFERQQREEEQQRQLIELQRAAEEERLKEAIREAQKREEEERLRREEEQRLKLLKEEAERKAREEAERQKAELQERLKNEEKEREARRKRVEAIMLRTRGKNNTGSAPQTEEKNAENKVNGSKTDAAENGHKNGKDIETVDNMDGKLDLEEFRLICRALFRNDKGKIYTLEEPKLKEVFDVFDKNGDGFIDRDEFTFCWNHWIKIIVRPISAFLIVDVQNDFISGTLNISNCSAQQNGAEVIEPINRLLETVIFDAVFYSLDWHPSDHVSFIDNIQQRELDPSSPVSAGNAKTYDTVIFAGPPPMKQRLWPRHCVQDTWGSELHQELKIVDHAIKVYKGTNPEVDSYSVFWDNKKLTDTTLCAQLRLKNATDIYICGLAYDVCVGATAVDALAIGYRTILLDDCSRGVDLLDIEKTKNTVIKNNGVIVSSSQVKAMVEGRDRRPELGYKLAMELKNSSSN